MKKMQNKAIAEIIVRKGNCISEEKLIALVENKLSDAEKKGFAEHFKTCRRCTKLWAEYAKFSLQPVTEDGKDFKIAIHEKIIPKKESSILNFAVKNYYAIAAAIMLAVTIGTLLYSHFEINEMRDSLKRENEIKNNAIAQNVSSNRKIDVSNQNIKENKKMPVVGVPYHDLYPEGIYDRGTSEIETPVIYFNKEKPFLLILNLTKPVKNPFIARVFNSKGIVVWKLRIPAAPESSITLLVSEQSLQPGEYIIKLEDESSQNKIALYRFQLTSNTNARNK